MKRRDYLRFVEELCNEELLSEFYENVIISWEIFDSCVFAKIGRYDHAQYEHSETRVKEIFIHKYIETVSGKYFREPMWILDLYNFITENCLEYLIADAGMALRSAGIGEEVWDVALSQNPEIIEMYLWAVDGGVDDEAVKTMEEAGKLDSFIEALTDMVKHIKKSLRSYKTTDSMKESYEKYIHNLYEAWVYGVMQDMLAKWDEEELKKIKKDLIPFLEANYC